MVISDENYFPILIDNVEIPMKTDRFWIFNLEHKDFMLTPLIMFEERTDPIHILNIAEYSIEIPSYWNILCYSEDTSQLDILEVSEISRGHYTAVIFDHQGNRVLPGIIHTNDWKGIHKIQTVSLNKNSMLCHALGKDYWICVSPTDNYNKYLKNAVIGDLT